jgi:hypothetical protein
VIRVEPTAGERLLSAVPPARRPLARRLLSDPRCGGHGLRAWVSQLDALALSLPATLPSELVEVYLADDDAEPLHDCEGCGLAVPVRVARRCGHEAAVEREYFPVCPCCGGKTGRFAYWSRQPRVARS